MDEEMKQSLTDVSLKYGELGAKLAVDYVFELINAAIKTSDNKFDDAFLPTINSLKPIVIAMADQINKENN